MKGKNVKKKLLAFMLALFVAGCGLSLSGLAVDESAEQPTIDGDETMQDVDDEQGVDNSQEQSQVEPADVEPTDDEPADDEDNGGDSDEEADEEDDDGEND